MEIFLKIPNYFCFSLLLPFGLLYTVVQVVHCTTAPTLKNESGLKSNPPSPCQAECPNVGLHPPEGRVPFPNHTKSQSALLITHLQAQVHAGGSLCVVMVVKHLNIA